MTKWIFNHERWSKSDRIFLSIALSTSVLQGIWAVYNYGYMGQDFGTHTAYALDYFGWFNFKTPNAPLFYWVPRIVLIIFGQSFFLEIVAILFLLINTAALLVFYGILLRLVHQQWIRFGIFLILTFLPARAIHAIVLAGDAAMLLPFVMVTMLATEALSQNAPTRQLRLWGWISFWTSVGIAFKYSFVALCPGLFLIYLYQVRFQFEWSRFWSHSKLVAVTLAIPTLVFSYHMFKSYQVESYTTTTHWKKPGDTSNMNWNDILFVKKSDLDLFNAPYYYDLEILENHKYSYPALLHMATFSDSMHFWQDIPKDISRHPFERTGVFDFPKHQPNLAHKLSRASIGLSVWISIFAVFGSVVVFVQSIVFFLRGEDGVSPAAAVLAIFSFGFYLIMVLNFTKLAQPYQWGYWLPRYVVPSLLGFITFGLMQIDKVLLRLPRHRELVAFSFFVLCAAYSGLYIWIL